jgi:hypothetical protein
MTKYEHVTSKQGFVPSLLSITLFAQRKENKAVTRDSSYIIICLFSQLVMEHAISRIYVLRAAAAQLLSDKGAFFSSF